MHTIAQLQREIAELESQILKCENTILRKQIAIEEIIQCRKCQMPAVRIRVETPSESTVKAPSAISLIQGVLAEFNGHTVTSRELRRLCLERYPQHKRSEERRGG